MLKLKRPRALRILIMMTNTFVQLDIADTDDGIPAYWEIFHFQGVTNTNPYDDEDFHDSDNYSESIALTDPGDGESIFRLSSPMSNPFLLSLLSYFSRIYTLNYASNLISGSWSNLIYEMLGG